MVFTIVFNWQVALLIHRGPARAAWRWLVVGVATNLALLAYFKYTNFFWDQATRAGALVGITLPEIGHVALPIGVSFFTFHAISYLVQTHRGECVPLRSVIDVGTYISCFPQLVAGPIVRFTDVQHQMHDRPVTARAFCDGIHDFAIGLGKKVLLANSVGHVADAAFALPPSQLTFGASWLGIVCYTFQIYFDFSGYSDMAIGLGKMLGFRFPRNFNRPYAATSVTDFWRRWHMTLSSFFRDFLYIPLGGNRGGVARTYVNLAIVFFLTGLWHGAAWTFVFWGALHGTYLVVERVARNRWNVGPHGVAGWAGTMVAVMVAWVYFRADTIAYGHRYVATMLGLHGVDPSLGTLRQYESLELATALVVSAVISAFDVGALARSVRDRWFYEPVRLGGAFALLLLAFVYLSDSSFNPFIYFRF
jgi:alginate O-acetyltransferase complex protein AlgI